MNSLVSTFLIGMLLASIALNVHQWQGGLCDTPELNPESTEMDGTGLPVNIDVEQLGLSAEQREVLGSCGNGCCCAAMALREEVRVATVELQEACAAQDVDEETLMTLADKLCTLREREVKEHVEALLAVREVLNPEQMEELYKSACEGCPSDE